MCLWYILFINYFFNAYHVICDNFTEPNNVDNDLIILDQSGIYESLVCYMYINNLVLWLFNVLVYSA